MAQLDRARRHERKLERRAARTRRSKWLGRLLFSLTGMGLLLLLRLNPDAIEAAVAHLHDVPSRSQIATLQTPEAVQVRTMPTDVTPVRRGGALPGNGTRAPQADTQAQADNVAHKLRSLSPGG
ncbi:hypothetical protein [Tateyamaria sp. SN3-11]|uniref:hypothetical protein n=1 Tax=Tateyamaria sp. SN3-11 TaxID=3092147 RepID=UPI0039EBA509